MSAVSCATSTPRSSRRRPCSASRSRARRTLPQYGIDAAFLGEGSGTLEIFTFADPDVLDPRLDGAERRIDHVAFRVEDLDALAAELRAAGARFSGPDRRGEIAEPIELGGSRTSGRCRRPPPGSRCSSPSRPRSSQQHPLRAADLDLLEAAGAEQPRQRASREEPHVVRARLEVRLERAPADPQPQPARPPWSGVDTTSRPPGPTTRATSAKQPQPVLHVLEHLAQPGRVEAAVGETAAPPRRHTTNSRSPWRARARRTGSSAASTPTTENPAAASAPQNHPAPQPTSRLCAPGSSAEIRNARRARSAPVRCRAARARGARNSPLARNLPATQPEIRCTVRAECAPGGRARIARQDRGHTGMRVAFDSRAKGDPRGIGRYVRCLLEALRETAAQDSVITESHRPRRSDVFHSPWLDGAQLRCPVPDGRHAARPRQPQAPRRVPAHRRALPPALPRGAAARSA